MSETDGHAHSTVHHYFFVVLCNHSLAINVTKQSSNGRTFVVEVIATDAIDVWKSPRDNRNVVGICERLPK